MGKMGADAEAEGRTEDALHEYRMVARFGERLRLQSHTLIEQLIGLGVQTAAYKRLMPALKKAGKEDEAAAVDYAQQQLLKDLDRLRGDPRERTSSRAWAILLANVAGTAVWIFLLLSLVSVSYVNAKLWVRREKKGRLYQFMTVVENYAPWMLFTSCLALGLIYAPFALNFLAYMAGSQPPFSWDEFLGNSFPTTRGLGRLDLPISNPYHGFVAYALAIAGLMVVIAMIRARFAARRIQNR
jgi:hypothetical protein